MKRDMLLQAMRNGEILWADDRILFLGDPAQSVSGDLVNVSVREGVLKDRWVAKDYCIFDVVEE